LGFARESEDNCDEEGGIRMKKILNPVEVTIGNYDVDILLRDKVSFDLGEEVEVLVKNGILRGKTITGVVKKVCYDSFTIIKETGEIVKVTPAYVEIKLVRVRIKDENSRD